MGSPATLRNLILGLALGFVLFLFAQAGNPQQPELSNWGSRSAVGFAAPIGANAGGAALRGVFAAQDSQRPNGNPLRARNTVMTQGYGVGSHAPAATWGAIDLALDGNGDGFADPDGTWEQPVYATHAGEVTVTANSWPAGNHIWVANEAYRTGYAHLAGFAVASGDYVEAGDLIGYIGSTGMSSGPHLDYQIWERVDGAWVNRNPLDFNPLP